MSSLFRSLNHFSSKRENVVKGALINTLNENAREIEFEVKQKSLGMFWTGVFPFLLLPFVRFLSLSEVLGLCEQTSSLCITLEALFLHGLKDSFLSATFNVLAGDVERRPDPSFWSPCLVFMHKQVIEQIQSLSQITSETGQCRAWIRQSLNESVFSSYFTNIRRNGSALGHYYKRHALLRDSEGLETAAKIMESLEAHVQFDLPVNSSLLNYWPDQSLQQSDLWTPALKACPVGPQRSPHGLYLIIHYPFIPCRSAVARMWPALSAPTLWSSPHHSPCKPISCSRSPSRIARSVGAVTLGLQTQVSGITSTC